MNLTTIFNIDRLGMLLRVELRKNFKGILITLVVILGVHFVGFVLDNTFSGYKVYSQHEIGYTFFLLLGGFIISSLSFSDLGSTQKRHNYLTLPASVFEKFLSGWLLSGIGWVLLFSIIFTIYSIFANAIGYVFFRHTEFVSFVLFSNLPITAIKYYIVLQGIFLVGAVNFRGYVFIKTLFTLFIFGIIGGVIFYFLMANIIQNGTECSMEECNPTQIHTFAVTWEIIKWLFWWILAPLSWVLTFIGLKDQEV